MPRNNAACAPRYSHNKFGAVDLCRAALRPHSNLTNCLIKKRKRGQAAVEYVLLVAMMSVIFGLVFANVRKSLFRLWVCEMGPRIQSTTACGGLADTDSCWRDLILQSVGTPNSENIRLLQAACKDASQ